MTATFGQWATPGRIRSVRGQSDVMWLHTRMTPSPRTKSIGISRFATYAVVSTTGLGVGDGVTYSYRTSVVHKHYGLLHITHYQIHVTIVSLYHQ